MFSITAGAGSNAGTHGTLNGGNCNNSMIILRSESNYMTSDFGGG